MPSRVASLSEAAVYGPLRLTYRHSIASTASSPAISCEFVGRLIHAGQGNAVLRHSPQTQRTSARMALDLAPAAIQRLLISASGFRPTTSCRLWLHLWHAPAFRMVTWIAKVDLGVKSFPLVDQRLRMALVATVSSGSTEPVGGGNTAVAKGILSREVPALRFLGPWWWSLLSVCFHPERLPRRAMRIGAHRPPATDLSFLWSASSSSGRGLCPRQSASTSAPTRDRRLHHDLQRHIS
jgi:hypothetical protein